MKVRDHQILGRPRTRYRGEVVGEELMDGGCLGHIDAHAGDIGFRTCPIVIFGVKTYKHQGIIRESATSC